MCLFTRGCNFKYIKITVRGHYLIGLSEVNRELGENKTITSEFNHGNRTVSLSNDTGTLDYNHVVNTSRAIITSSDTTLFNFLYKRTSFGTSRTFPLATLTSNLIQQ
jgi:hypothetical protein